MKRLIGFVGFKSSGKNTAAQVLIDHHDFVSFSFADALKDALASIFCWPRDLLEGITDESRAWRETVDPWWAKRLQIENFTPRWAMTRFGTDIMRQHFHPEIWMLNMERRLEQVGDKSVLIPDIRFPNELALIHRHHGRIARIQRGLEPNWVSFAKLANKGVPYAQAYMTKIGVHPSEWAWLGYPIDQIIYNDGEIATLHASVVDWVSANEHTHQM